MTVLQLIYGTDPYGLWLCVAGLMTAVAVTTGSNLPMGSAAAGFAVGALSAATGGLGLPIEAGLFAALALALTAPLAVRARKAAEPAATATVANHPARLIGRIARSTGDFANGVGRVWIDGTEWAAELDGGEDAVPQGSAVRVTRVLGGVRLQVHPLAA